MRTSLYRESMSVLALTSGTRTNGTVNGTTVDRAGLGDPSVLFVVTTAAVTDGTHTFTVQDSDDGTTWAAAAAGDVQGTAPVVNSTKANTVLDVGYRGSRRYCRLSVTTSGATTGGVYSAAAVLYGLRYNKDR